MATLQTQSTGGAPLIVTYPAERFSRPGAPVRVRIGKKSTLPAYTNANLPHLVQFDTGQQTVIFMLSDVLQTSYWQRVRNAYNWLGQLDVAEEVKVAAGETRRILQWLRDQSAARGITLAGVHCQASPRTNP